MLKTKTINDVKISKIKLPVVAQKKIRGSCVLPIYSNTFLCAKKNSGKTTTIYNMLKKCVDKDTVLDLFVSTIEKDRSWIQIVKHFRGKGCIVNAHTSTVDNDGNDRIRELIDTPMEFSDEEESSSESEEDLKYISIGGEETKEPTERKRRKTKLAQKRIIVLDDIGNELSGVACHSC